MSHEECQLSLRLSADLVERADATIDRLAQDPSMYALAGSVTRSTVIRLALARGLDVLDQELPGKPRRRRKTK